MSRDVLNTQRPPGTDADLVIREARRRQRRRRRLTGLAVAVALAGTAGVTVSLHSPGQSPLSRPRPRSAAPASVPLALPGPIPHGVRTTLLMWPVGYPAFGPHMWPPAYVDDLATGHLSQRHKLAFAGGDYRPYLVRVGHWLAYVGDRGAMVIRDDLKGRPRALGRTPFFAPAASPGHIWLERIRGDLGEGGRASAWQVSVRAGRRGPVIALPRNSGLIAGTDAGLLLEVLRGHDFSLALWRPGGPPRALPYAPRSNYGLDATARLLAYGTGCIDPPRYAMITTRPARCCWFTTWSPEECDPSGRCRAPPAGCPSASASRRRSPPAAA